MLEQEQEEDLPVLVPRGEEISDALAAKIEESGMTSVHIRSPLTWELRYGICGRCYGRDMATGGWPRWPGRRIVAAESIGEPGTQLTMRTFHTGGVAAEY